MKYKVGDLITEGKNSNDEYKYELVVNVDLINRKYHLQYYDKETNHHSIYHITYRAIDGYVTLCSSFGDDNEI